MADSLSTGVSRRMSQLELRQTIYIPYYKNKCRRCRNHLHLYSTKLEFVDASWGSAYALSRIILLEEYRNTDLYEELVIICDNEQENGVRNQYLKAFKKIKK